MIIRSSELILSAAAEQERLGSDTNGRGKFAVPVVVHDECERHV